MKSYTDIEQSKKLAEILPLESADIYYLLMPDGVYNHYPLTGWKNDELQEPTDLPCWSLTALLDVLPPIEGFRPIIDLDINLIRYEGNYRDELCFYGNNLVDVCVEMIERLHELNLL